MSSKARRIASCRIVLAVVALTCVGVLASDSAAQAAQPPVAVGGACEDARYKALLQTDIGSRGDGEHAYFLALDNLCREHKRQLAGAVAGSVESYNACAHAPYADLAAAKTPAGMTNREYAYFVVVDRECTAYKEKGGKTRRQAGPSPGRQFVTSLAVIGSIIATVVASLQ
jgi:hypothetical protein